MSLNLKYKKVIRILKANGVGVMSTDTLYGLVGGAFSKSAVERIYKIKKRNTKKPLIILISKISDLEKFGIKISTEHTKILKKFWPGEVSVILDCKSKKFKYLHRGTKSLAFRLPKNKKLTEILKKTGPLVAPSANPEGQKPARSITEAERYFQKSSDFYLSGGELKGEPSILVKLNKKGKIKILRGKIK